MGLIASYIVPHTLSVVKELSKGQERYFEKTIKAYEAIADEIASLAPDTIVIASPHAESYSDFFQIADGETVTGSFKEYGAPQVKFRFHYDDELRNEITRVAASKKFPAGYEGSEDPKLDHGTMVPLYFIRRKYSSFKLVRLGLSGLSFYDHYKMGQYIAMAAKNLNKKVVFIASGDMSHCLSEDSLYGYRDEGKKYENLLNIDLKNGNFGNLLRMDHLLITKAKECGHRAFSLLAGTLDRKISEPICLSHEVVFGVGYGVYSFKVKGEDPSRAYGDLYASKVALDIKAKLEKCDDYVKLAYLTLDQFLNKTAAKEVSISTDFGKKKEGVVVSIYKFGTLRADFGSIVPLEKNVPEEIIQASVKAAKKDTFFDPIEPSELPYLDIVVDEIKNLEPISSEKDLDPNKYGVLLKTKNGKLGFALPFIPGVESVEKQIRIAKRDFDIKPNEKVILFRFTIVRHK